MTKAETTYYKIDGRKLSFADLRRCSPNAFVCYLIYGLSRLHIPLQWAFAIPFPPRFSVIDQESVPKETKESFEDFHEQWQTLGFFPVLTYTLDYLGRHQVHARLWLDAEKSILASTIIGRSTFQNGSESTQIVHKCTTAFGESLLLNTSSNKYDLTGPPEFHKEFVDPLTPKAVFDHHKSRLPEFLEDIVPIQEHEVAECMERWTSYEAQWSIDTGLYSPLTQKERESYARDIDDPSCLRCGDFSDSVKNHRYPGYCEGCHEFAKAEFEAKRKKQMLTRLFLVSALAALLVVLTLLRPSFQMGLGLVDWLAALLLFSIITFVNWVTMIALYQLGAFIRALIRKLRK